MWAAADRRHLNPIPWTILCSQIKGTLRDLKDVPGLDETFLNEQVERLKVRTYSRTHLRMRAHACMNACSRRHVNVSVRRYAPLQSFLTPSSLPSRAR